jgi:hypothetical protein
MLPRKGREVRARKACGAYIQIGVMEKDIHGAMYGRDRPPAGETAEDACPGALGNSAKKTRETGAYRVIVDLPDLLPVTEGELELLESELADCIAELLKT